MLKYNIKTQWCPLQALIWTLLFLSPANAEETGTTPLANSPPGSEAVTVADSAADSVPPADSVTSTEKVKESAPSETSETGEKITQPEQKQSTTEPETVKKSEPEASSGTAETETTSDTPDSSGTPEATEQPDSAKADPGAETTDPQDAAKAVDSGNTASSATTSAAAATGALIGAAAGAAADATTVSKSDLLSMYEKQQKQLDEQLKQIEAQRQLLESMQSQQTGKIEAQKEIIAKQTEQIEAQRQSMQSMQTQIDQLSDAKAQDMSEEDIELRSRLETLESSIKSSEESASTTFDEKSFPGSTIIPGTTAAIRFGGFVKMNIVETFNPLGSLDRFIAGTIPVPQQSQSPRTSMTVSQSRLNWELRDRTSVGVMRAFIEADFAGGDDDDTFRLRHAYGQFGDVLAGKTWTAFMDVDASPEELDFEGINGRVNVRQPQVRYFPKIGKDWDLVFALEDPSPEITGGTAISQFPDIVSSARRTWFDRWHIKTSLVLRQITGSWDEDSTGETEDKVTGWGVSVSGKTSTQFWNKLGLDNIMFQFNGGKGIGHYINDLDTIGGEDAVFNSQGTLKSLPVFAGYLAYQHWWKENIRSTLNLSWVYIDNLSFQPPDAYKRTVRSAVNLIWSPAARIDIGGEFIWGKRENNNNENATAAQIQASVKYRF